MGTSAGRLSRAGNRRLNHVLYMAGIVQMRHDTDGRAYYRRKLSESKTPMEAMRCLRRRLSDVVYANSSPTPQPGARTRTRRAREDTPGRLFNPARPTYPRTSALRISHFPDPHPRRYPCQPRPRRDCAAPITANQPARRRRQPGAPHRTNEVDTDKRRRTIPAVEAAHLTAPTTEGSHDRTLRVNRLGDERT